jgi:hypothetical protein
MMLSLKGNNQKVIQKKRDWKYESEKPTSWNGFVISSDG